LVVGQASIGARMKLNATVIVEAASLLGGEGAM
jgi:hypothetical protein